ncbi:MAG: hypothetical protein ACR2LN_04125 [Candidatus Levyibacteriota bacterium]
MSENEPRGIFKKRSHIVMSEIAEGITPLAVRALMHRNPEIAEQIHDLQAEKVPVFVSKLHNTPYPIRAIVSGKDDMLNRVLDDPLPDEPESVQQVREVTEVAFKFLSPDATEEHQGTLDELNSHPAVAEKRKKIAKRRLVYDRPSEELAQLAVGGGVGIGAAVLATVLEANGQEGWGLLVAQGVDDVTNAGNVGASEGGGRKSLRTIMKENILVLPILGGAALADNTFIPHMLEGPLPVRLAGGALFTAAAVGGSLGVNVGNIIRSAKTIKEQDSEGALTTRDTAKEAVKRNLAHPFRKWLWIGMGAALVAAEYTAGTGILVGHPYSGTLQTVIGEMETLGGFAGLFLSNTAINAKDNIKDWLQVTYGKKTDGSDS